MSDLRSVIAFFIGLVVFVFLVVFAVSRIMPKKQTTVKTAQAVTVTPTPTVVTLDPTTTKKPSLWNRFTSVFKTKPKTTPTPSPAPMQVIVETDSQALPTLEAVLRSDTGAKKVYVQNTVNGVTTIPETGAETLFIPASLLMASAGMWLRKRN